MKLCAPVYQSKSLLADKQRTDTKHVRTMSVPCPSEHSHYKPVCGRTGRTEHTYLGKLREKSEKMTEQTLMTELARAEAGDRVNVRLSVRPNIESTFTQDVVQMLRTDRIKQHN